MSKSTRVALALTCAAALACVAWILWPRPSDRLVATVSVGGEVVRTVDLTATANQVFSIDSQRGGSIEFEIRDHQIAFRASDCPDKL